MKVAKTGDYNVAVTYSCSPGAEGSRFTVEVAGQKVRGTSLKTQSWSTYRTESLGKVTLAKPGVYTLAVKPDAEMWKVIGLKSVILSPVQGNDRNVAVLAQFFTGRPFDYVTPPAPALK